MLIEMVAVTLTVFSGFSPLTGVFSREVTYSPTPPISSEIVVLQKLTTAQEGVVFEDESLLSQGLTVHDQNTSDAVYPTPKALDGDLPEETIVAMLAEPTPTMQPTATPTPSPTSTPSPTPTATPLPTDTPTPTPPPVVVAPGDLDSLFARFADEYKVDKELLKRIAKCESGFNQEAVNGDYLGMFQYAASSWSGVRTRMGADPNPDLRKNAEETIKTAAYHIANGGAGSWPSCK